jgi:hypothetical protein
MSGQIQILPSSLGKMLMLLLQGRLRTKHHRVLLDAQVFLLGGKE